MITREDFWKEIKIWAAANRCLHLDDVVWHFLAHHYKIQPSVMSEYERFEEFNEPLFMDFLLYFFNSNGYLGFNSVTKSSWITEKGCQLYEKYETIFERVRRK